jgi:hypothetical protein
LWAVATGSLNEQEVNSRIWGNNDPIFKQMARNEVPEIRFFSFEEAQHVFLLRPIPMTSTFFGAETESIGDFKSYSNQLKDL